VTLQSHILNLLIQFVEETSGSQVNEADLQSSWDPHMVSLVRNEGPWDYQIVPSKVNSPAERKICNAFDRPRMQADGRNSLRFSGAQLVALFSRLAYSMQNICVS